MENQTKTKEQLLIEIDQFGIEIGELKRLEIDYKKVEEALRHERELYHDLASAQPTGVYRIRVFSTQYLSEEIWLNAEKSPLVIEYCNDRFCEILKINRQEIASNPGIVQELVLEADKAAFTRANIRANLKLIPFEWEGRFSSKGEIIWLHIESLPRLLKNGDIIWTGILMDITMRKNVELEIKLQNEELKKANAEKDKFFSIIAHDLRNPLNIIVGYSELLAEQVINKDLEGIEEYADIIMNSSLMATDLLKNLMEWSLSKTGRMNFNPEYFKMIKIVDEVVLLFVYIAKQKSISITNKVHPMTLVYADKIMISTIIRNLVSNAIKFTKVGGTVSISSEEKQNEVTVKISDNGVGIPKKVIEKLFRIDQNYSTSGTKKEQGTGLGLILCKEFVEKHSGIIGVKSEEDIGSMFYFTIPSIANPEAETKKELVVSQV